MPITTRAAGFAIFAFAAAAPAPALAGSAVYGGSTSAGAAIVIKADKKAKKLRSAVVSWKANCDDGRRFPVAVPLKAVTAEPGFTPGFRELATSRNGKGRFAGTQVGSLNMGDSGGLLTASYSGKLTKTRATGTLDATITVVENATGNTITTCRTGSVRYSASRSPGRVFGGSTSQDHPVVVRLDARRRKVADLLFGWESATCKPDDLYLSVDEKFGDFALGGGNFGDAFNVGYSPDGGGEGKVAYDISGRVARTRANGRVRVNLTETDATGAVTTACDSGIVPWEAISG
jgi:hypothetical protein